MVEKLQELRSMRIQKLKKQGHFLPEEDDKFLEKVQAAVEEEERQALAAADTDAAKDAIATAEETRMATQNQRPISKDLISNQPENNESKDQMTPNEDEKDSSTVTVKESGKTTLEGHGCTGAYDSLTNLPIEFYHYYHGSNSDMGTLIEVRRTWDAYIRPGGRMHHKAQEHKNICIAGLSYNMTAAAYQATGFSRRLLLMRYGHPTW